MSKEELCSCSGGPKLIFACSGVADVGEIADKAARKLTKEAMRDTSDSSIATVYYAYDPKGRYLGGDTWHNE